jgi:hypothetical protein
MNSARQMNNNSRKINKSDKKYCGICHKAGKSVSEYESHYTKSVPGPKGIITCPMILASVCNRCGNSGHFSDHCTLKKNMPFKNNRLSLPNPNPGPGPGPGPSVSVWRSENGFAALSVADDDDDEVVMPVVKRPKITVEKEIASLAPNGVSFASMLLKPAPAPVIETSFKISTKLQTLIDYEKSEKMELAKSIINKGKRRSWISDSESDSEDDCEYEDNTAW